MPYSFALDGTPEEQSIAFVRNEIDDASNADSPKEGRDYFLSDERILHFLGSARLEAAVDAAQIEVSLMACAAILDTLATNQAYVLKKRRTLGEETDGPAVAASIRSHAVSLRTRAKNSLIERRAAAALIVDAQAQRPRNHQLRAVPRFP